MGGILIEKRAKNGRGYYVIGVGINVLQRDFSSLPQASSLSIEAGREFDLHDFTKGLYRAVVEGLFLRPSEQEIMRAFNQVLFRKDQISVFEAQNGVRQNGIIRRALPDGTLLVEFEKEGTRQIRHKEYKLLY